MSPTLAILTTGDMLGNIQYRKDRYEAMSVQNIEYYTQKDGRKILKVILTPTKNFPNGVTYVDACFEDLIRQYTWFIEHHGYVVASVRIPDKGQTLIQLHREIMQCTYGFTPDYVDHISGVMIDNVGLNLEKVTNSQNIRNVPKRGYRIQGYGKTGAHFQLKCQMNNKSIHKAGIEREDDACIQQFFFELQHYSEYNYDFLKDRRNDLDIVDLERSGKISNEEATYLHVKKYVENNPWYAFRYNLFDYCKQNNIIIPKYYLNEDKRMVDVNGKILCPFKTKKEREELEVSRQIKES